MTQKIIKVGNSMAVTIPKEYVAKLQLVAGQPIRVELSEKEQLIQINPHMEKNHKLNPEFVRWADHFIEENIDLFKELARLK